LIPPIKNVHALLDILRQDLYLVWRVIISVKLVRVNQTIVSSVLRLNVIFLYPVAFVKMVIMN